MKIIFFLLVEVVDIIHWTHIIHSVHLNPVRIQITHVIDIGIHISHVPHVVHGINLIHVHGIVLMLVVF